ncbi:MAG: bifunctional phosphoribosylaminoimidazolecarboxamide formyltransferase/IMP cyclohydrolase [Calditrichia bacterium]
MIAIKRALLSCWDKSGLVELAKTLVKYDVEIISSGGTAVHLEKNQISVTPVDRVTEFPEVLGGRVKTLHPHIHAGLLAKRSREHKKELKNLGIEAIQLVVGNLYPFVGEAVAQGLAMKDAVEYIDIGGPTMMRAAAKNNRNAIVLFDREQYGEFMQILNENDGQIPEAFSLRRARELFFYTSWYDGQVQEYIGSQIDANEEKAPRFVSRFIEKIQDVRYGENPHQHAAVYRPYLEDVRGLAALEQLWGKPMSYNNYMDAQAAYDVVLEFSSPAVVIVKHTNPCGTAVSSVNIADAFKRALKGDPVSSFGGIVALNKNVDKKTAELMSKIFFECVIAPGFSPAALEILKKKKNIRLLKLHADSVSKGEKELKSINGGYLMQQPDHSMLNPKAWKVVTKKKPSSNAMREMEFAWKICKHVKSNAIVLTRDMEIFGVGAGQMSRVDAVTLAKLKAEQAGREMSDLVLASDAFFPFRDGIDQAVAAGAMAVIQPGGSIRDDEVIKAADEHGISMIFTGYRHFKH